MQNRSAISLFDGVADVVERLADISTERPGTPNDGDRNQRGDQAVLDGGGTGFIPKKSLHKRAHSHLSAVFVALALIRPTAS